MTWQMTRRLRSRRGVTSAVAGISAALVVTACGSASPQNATPVSSTLPSAAPSTAASPTSAAVSGASTTVAGVRFPPGLTVKFETPLPSGGSQRDVVEALEDQQAAFMYALYVKNSDVRYEAYTEANGLPVFQSMLSHAGSGGSAASGSVEYFDVQLTQSIFSFPSGSGTAGTFCLAISGGLPSSAMPSGGYTFSMHKDPGSDWKVASVTKGGATCGA